MVSAIRSVCKVEGPLIVIEAAKLAILHKERINDVSIQNFPYKRKVRINKPRSGYFQKARSGTEGDTLEMSIFYRLFSQVLSASLRDAL